MHATLNSGDIQVRVYPKKPTLLLYDSMSGWYVKLKQQADLDIRQRQREKLGEILREYPELSELITSKGGLNPYAIQQQEAIYKRKGLTEEEAKEKAVKDVEDKLTYFAAEHPKIAMALYFPSFEYPRNLASILLAIDCVRQTCDYDKLNNADKELISDKNETVVTKLQNAISAEEAKLAEAESSLALLNGKKKIDESAVNTQKEIIAELSSNIERLKKELSIAPYDTDFWRNVEWEGVAEYATLFCSMYKRD